MSDSKWAVTGYQGARWWKFDFHTHTPASSDYGSGSNQAELRSRTPRQWIQDYLDAGIDCVAVTDHNCGDWIDPLKQALEEMREEEVPRANEFYIFPGVELTIDGVHYLAIFDPSASSRTIQDLLAVASCNHDHSNAQAYCRESVSKIYESVLKFNGLFIPAHVDLESTGLFKHQENHSALDPVFKLEGILAMEVADRAFKAPESYHSKKLKWARILGSDSHHPSRPSSKSEIVDPRFPGSHYTWVKMATPCIEGLRLALIDGQEFSIGRSDESFEPDSVPDDFVERVVIKDAAYMGHGNEAKFFFSPWLNALVGGRGSGKSTVVHLMRLALQRGYELEELQQESEPAKVFEGFNKLVKKRGDKGGLNEDTVVVIYYRHEEQRYRIKWWAGRIEEYEFEVSEWNEEEGVFVPIGMRDISGRFPIRIFSQGQIGELANERSGALLQLVDEAIEAWRWTERWVDQEVAYFRKCDEIRRIKLRLQGKDRVAGRHKDVSQKLKKFQEGKHEQVLKDYRQMRSQSKEFKNQVEEARTIGNQIKQYADEILVSDVPTGVFSDEDETGKTLFLAIQKIQNAVWIAQDQIRNVADELVKAIVKHRADILDGEWHTWAKQVKKQYDGLLASLQEQGVTDFDEYDYLVKEHQEAEKQIQILNSQAKSLTKLKKERKALRNELQELRRALSKHRRSFLQEHVANNDYVRMELEAYGRDPQAVEQSLRDLLGLEPLSFESEIYSKSVEDEEEQGIVAELLNNLPDDQGEEMERRLEGLRKDLIAASQGKEVPRIGARLRNNLKKRAEQLEEFVDRIAIWHPEDSLRVTYSPAGDGKEFKPIDYGSAGQKSAAMLAFLLAYGSEPLILDQPEDDLDNHLIYNLVVKQIRENKRRRQIICITHNPNIVVNGDAEMIHVMEWGNGQCQVKTKGALQDQEVRDEICQVMEGGTEAFELRYRRIGGVEKGGHHV